MIGKWEGFFQHTTKYAPEKLRNRKTLFKLEITECKGNKFSGQVFDDLNTGGMEGIGIIEGTFDSDGVKFVKKMPQRTEYFPNGSVIKRNKPHPEILYEGDFMNNRNKISGTWIIKSRISFYRFRLYVGGGNGIFEMSKCI